MRKQGKKVNGFVEICKIAALTIVVITAINGFFGQNSKLSFKLVGVRISYELEGKVKG